MNLKKQTLVLLWAVITALSITVSIVSCHTVPDKHSSALLKLGGCTAPCGFQACPP